eukprot:scaffold2161_cov212-Alexandrium_tamarense.AAC.3
MAVTLNWTMMTFWWTDLLLLLLSALGLSRIGARWSLFCGERLGGWPLRSIVTQRFAPDILFVRRTVSGRMELCCREPDGAFSLASRLQRTSVHHSLVYIF